MTEAPSTRLLDAIKALSDFLKTKAADSTHPLSAIQGFGLYGDVSDVRLPSLDIWPGTLTRDGQQVRADIIFQITAPAQGSYAEAVRQIYVIERAIWRVVDTQLTGSAAARALSGGRLEYRGFIEAPKRITRGEGEAIETMLTADALAVWLTKDSHD